MFWSETTGLLSTLGAASGCGDGLGEAAAAAICVMLLKRSASVFLVRSAPCSRHPTSLQRVHTAEDIFEAQGWGNFGVIITSAHPVYLLERWCELPVMCFAVLGQEPVELPVRSLRGDCRQGQAKRSAVQRDSLLYAELAAELALEAGMRTEIRTLDLIEQQPEDFQGLRFI